MTHRIAGFLLCFGYCPAGTSGAVDFDNVTVHSLPIPEPSTVVLLLSAVLLCVRRMPVASAFVQPTLLLATLAGTSQAGLVLTDGDFQNWSQIDAVVNGGASSAANRIPVGGNPDAFWSVQHATPSPSAIAVFSRSMSGFDILPATLIGTPGFEFSLDYNPTGLHAFGLGIEQDGKIYGELSGLTQGSLGWKNYTKNLTLDDIGLVSPEFSNGTGGIIIDLSQKPDLSTTGTAITLGLLTANSRSSVQTVGYDNFSVSFDAIPEPASLSLLACGLVFVIRRSRCRKEKRGHSRMSPFYFPSFEEPRLRLSEEAWMKLLQLLVLAIAIGFATASHANIVTNGSFEHPSIAPQNTTHAAGSLDLQGWSIAGTSGVDHVRSLWQPAEGDQSVSLNWTSPSTISQTLLTEAGQDYQLSFSLAAEHPASNSIERTLDVFWGTSLVGSLLFDPTGRSNANMGWESHAFSVTGTGSDILSFVSTTTGNFGPAIDSVSVLAVPEPTALILSGTVLLVLVGWPRIRSGLLLSAINFPSLLPTRRANRSSH